MAEDRNQDGPGGLTRRKFLERLTKAGLGLAAGSIAGGPLVAGLQKPQEKTRPQFPQPVVPPPITPSVSDITSRDTSMPVSEKAEVKPTEPIPLKKELFFINTLDKEKIRDAREKIDGQVAHYKKEEKDLGGRISKTLKYKEMVMAVSKKLGFKKDSAVPELLLGLIFVESGGNPEAIAGNPGRKPGEKISDGDAERAKGLCQVKPDTAEEIAERLGIRTGSYSLFDPETNITFALEYLDRLYNKLFPDLGAVFWAYHLGEGNMASVIETYLTEELRVPKTTVDAVLSNKESPGTFKLVKDYNLGFLELINSKKVRERLRREKAFNDDTEFYVPRVGAAMRFLDL